MMQTRPYPGRVCFSQILPASAKLGNKSEELLDRG